MIHLIISREYPPASYAGGGIGTYVDQMSRLLAERGDTVHVIGELCPDAPERRDVRMEGRLIVHRVPTDASMTHEAGPDGPRAGAPPPDVFQWTAARLAESLIEHAGIDVVEAQDYEAPAFRLQQRRHQGRGPARTVPIVVHLHSPSEFVLPPNEWPDGPAVRARIRLEEYTIRSADALLCPSRFLARAAAERYEIEPQRITVIPLPHGAPSAPLERGKAVWREGTICYVGRLEPRKGVLEWTDAALAVAAERSGLQFSFVGADVPYQGDAGRSVGEILRARVPAALRSRFQFSDAVSRAALDRFRMHARIAVVPSRWENFPYACVEAMASGLPVIASPAGGMVDMIEDGSTGWIAERADARALERALRRALATPPDELSEMGRRAAESIRVLCDHRAVVLAHQHVKADIVRRGCRPSPQPLPDVPEPVWPADALSTSALTQGTLTPRQILRSPLSQQWALLRRACANPAHVMRWFAWHLHRDAGENRREPDRQ